MSITQEAVDALRKPFPAEEIGKLPRVTCKACRDDNCGQHRRQRCTECAGYVSPQHIHLSYVGHAEVTDRLLSIDPQWTWEPLALGVDGLPAFDRIGGLWIWLTVAGVTRLGYGHADNKSGGDAIKEIIGDAIRNAAMRYGVGLDMWRRSETPDAEPVEASDIQPAQQSTRAGEIRTKIAQEAQVKGYDLDTIAKDFTNAMNGADIVEAAVPVLAEYLKQLQGYPPAEGNGHG